MSLPPHEVIGSSVRRRANVPTLILELFAFAHRLTKSLERARLPHECAATRSIIAMCQFLARFSLSFFLSAVSLALVDNVFSRAFF